MIIFNRRKDVLPDFTEWDNPGRTMRAVEILTSIACGAFTAFILFFYLSMVY